MNIKKFLLLHAVMLCHVLTAAGPVQAACKAAWSFETGQQNFAAPAVTEQTAYVGGGDGAIHALNIENGQTRWRHEVGGAVDATPLVTPEAVYVQARDGYFRALDRRDGTLLWAFETGEPGPVDFWDFTLSGAVMAAERVLFGSGSGLLYALDAATGEVAWYFATGGAIRATPLVVGSTVFFGSFDGRFRALDVETGDLMWEFKTVGSTFFPEGAIQGSASHADGVIFFGSRDYNLYALDTETGTGRWNLRTPSWVIGPPAIDADHVYVGTSDSLKVYAVARDSGQVSWEQRLHARIFGTPRIYGDQLLVGAFNGRLHALDTGSGETLWSFATAGSRAHHHLVYDENDQWQDSFRELYRSGRAMDAEALILRLGSIADRVAVSGNTGIFSSTDGFVYALDLAECIINPAIK